MARSSYNTFPFTNRLTTSHGYCTFHYCIHSFHLLEYYYYVVSIIYCNDQWSVNVTCLCVNTEPDDIVTTVCLLC